MKEYLRHLPPAEQDAVRHTLEEFLSSGEQLFRLLYFFDCRQVVAYAGVFRRDAGGRPIQIIRAAWNWRSRPRIFPSSDML